jgi:hypothetical protein
MRGTRTPRHSRRWQMDAGILDPARSSRKEAARSPSWSVIASDYSPEPVNDVEALAS